MPQTILTIEDDAAIRRGIVDALQFAGFRVLQAGTFRAGQELATTEAYDLLLLDVLLPDGSGLDILDAVRETRPTKPVIMLTARGTEADRVAGLQGGADDYVIKPFSMRELMARVQAVLRRVPPEPETTQPFRVLGDGTLHLDRAEYVGPFGNRSELSPREVQLLEYFMAHPDRPVTRDELLRSVWGLDTRGVTTRTVDMHIARIREKLGDRGSDPQLILTVRGRGYLWQSSMCQPVEEQP
ncbi:MAG: response regulator transcription factor [Planctomycetaceae bacterium]|nr:response regulator transcription factor [Planctomycetaceae bacterium]